MQARYTPLSLDGMTALPPLPLPIRALRDAVCVLLVIGVGGEIAALPYGAASPDRMMIWTFQGVFGSLAFAVSAWFATRRRPVQLTLAVLIAWLLVGFVVAAGTMHPAWWAFLLPAIGLMALLGGGLCLLVERASRDHAR